MMSEKLATEYFSHAKCQENTSQYEKAKKAEM